MSNNELFLYIGFSCFFFAFIAFLQFLWDDYDIVMKEFRERVAFFTISIIVGLFLTLYLNEELITRTKRVIKQYDI